MGIHYDFYENPPKKESNRKPTLHARVVASRTVGIDYIGGLIHDMSTLTKGDVNAVLTMFREQLIDQLSYGNRVHWEGVGYFELSLSCPPISSPKEIRAESIDVKTIVFRPEKNLKKEFKSIPFTRVRRKNHSKRYSDIEIDSLLIRYFQDNPNITSVEFRRLCSFTHTTGNRRLKKLIEEGKIRKTGHARFPLYEPAGGYYRK